MVADPRYVRVCPRPDIQLRQGRSLARTQVIPHSVQIRLQGGSLGFWVSATLRLGHGPAFRGLLQGDAGPTPAFLFQAVGSSFTAFLSSLLDRPVLVQLVIAAPVEVEHGRKTRHRRCVTTAPPEIPELVRLKDCLWNVVHASPAAHPFASVSPSVTWQHRRPLSFQQPGPTRPARSGAVPRTPAWGGSPRPRPWSGWPSPAGRAP